VQYYAIISHPEKQPAKKQSAIHACHLSNLIASLVSLRAFVRYGHTVTPYSIPGMKTDRIRTDITAIIFVFIFMSGFGFEYG
jgi:hypothetical protein